MKLTQSLAHIALVATVALSAYAAPLSPKQSLDATVPPAHRLHEVQNNEQLERLLQQKRPTIVYFHAPWCTVCTEHMDAVMQKAAEEYANRISFVSVDYDKFKAQIQKLGVAIDGLPRMLFRRDGTSITQKGSRPEATFMYSVKLFLDNKLKPETETISQAPAPKAAQSKRPWQRNAPRQAHATRPSRPHAWQSA